MKLWVPAAALGLLGFGLWAAQQQQTAQDEPTRISVEVTRVNLLFTVTDKKGKFVTDLTKSDFEVVEARKPQVVQEFNAEGDMPLRLAILVDTSNSIRDRFRFEQEAAGEFLKSVIKTNQDKAMVVGFDNGPQLASDLVDDTDKLETAIRGLKPGGGTALYDAIFFTCKDKLAREQPMSKFRHAMVVLSDGDDNASNSTRAQALEMAQRADTAIYSISTNISRIESEGDKDLKYFAAETGGRAFFPLRVEDLETSFEDIASELRHQYNLAYRPEPLAADGAFHPIEVRVKGRKELMVHVRRGYYAPRM